jgi:hypothetical protein
MVQEWTKNINLAHAWPERAILSTKERRHDTQHNDIQHNDTQHNDILHNDIPHNDIQHCNK